MAEIHRAADTQQELCAVAIKFMVNTRIRDDRIVREAFGRELAALNALKHPNIVKIIDFDPRHDPPYIVLEWLEQDLVSWLGSAALRDWNDFYERVGRPVLDALVFALTKRVVHRDLKPGNVMVDDYGTVKVTDFGISKLGLASLPAGGPTLAAFKSEPYAPLEDGAAAESRDAYAFAVLALRCFAEREFSSHEDVAKALDGFTGPAEAREVLAKALAADPTSRFANVLDLQNALERVQAAERVVKRQTTPCYFFVLPQAVAKLCERLGVSDERRVQRSLERDITESLLLLFWRDPQTQIKIEHQFLGRTSQFRLHIGIDSKTRDRLVVLSAWPDEAISEFGYKPPVDVAFGRPPPSVDAVGQIRWLVEAVTQHEFDDADARRERQGEELLREWAATLRFRQSVEEGRHAAIPYSEYRLDGNRIYFAVPSLPDGVFVDQPRMVKQDQHSIVSGLIDEIGPSFVSLWVEHGTSAQLPERGQLVIDNRASRVAIERQKGALDAVRYGRCLRPSLRELILDPSAATAPKDIGEVSWAQNEFDEDKKAAVRMALGAPEILVVQGPPGTGKTRFITELVVQTLLRTPEAKILMTSQTHVALDNALERLHQLMPSTTILRVAQRDDARVSPKVQDLTIERVAEKWRQEVAKASERFLASVAKELGVNREDIALGMAAGRLRAESAELDRVEARLADYERQVRNAEVELARAHAGHVADHYHETSEAIDELREQVRDLNERRKVLAAQRREAARELAGINELGKQLAVASSEELAEWEHGLLAGTEADRKCHSFIRLAEDWQLRFAASREFYAAMVASSSVVAGTCLGFARVPGMLAAEFDVCIVDEASKATATELLVPLARAKRWVLVGDPRQLPPFVEDLLDDPELLGEHELNRESFQRTLLDRFILALPKANVAALATQHRMTRAIGDLVSACFYDGALKSVRDDREFLPVTALPAPVTWYTTAKLPGHDESHQNGAIKNVAEARFIGQWLKRLNFVARSAGKQLRVAVITGYNGQCAELERTLARIQGEVPALSFECNTVDAFQGREADICVYSVTRCNDRGLIGFLRDARRMNVALSRGRNGLVIVGDHVFCRNAREPNPLRTVLEYIDGHGGDCRIEEAIL